MKDTMKRNLRKTLYMSGTIVPSSPTPTTMPSLATMRCSSSFVASSYEICSPPPNFLHKQRKLKKENMLEHSGGCGGMGWVGWSSGATQWVRIMASIRGREGLARAKG